MKNKVQEWVGEAVQLSQIASSQPQAAYAALTHGLISKWTYLQRTVDDISDIFKPLEEAIRLDFLPALTRRTGINNLERNLLELPARLGGLGIVNPMKTAANQHSSSLRITAPLPHLFTNKRRNTRITSPRNKQPSSEL